MAVTLPTPWVAGEKIKASRLNGFNSAFQSKFAAGIRSEDLAADAGVKGTQISTAAGTRITNANLENLAVDSRVLKSVAAAGHTGAAVTRDHIVSGEIQSDHYAAGSVNAAALGALAATLAKLNLTTYSHVPAIPVAINATVLVDTGLSVATTLPLAIYVLRATDVSQVRSLQSKGGTWWVAIRGSNTVTTDLASNELKVVYIQ